LGRRVREVALGSIAAFAVFIAAAPAVATRAAGTGIRVTETGLQRLEANLALVDFAPTIQPWLRD